MTSLTIKDNIVLSTDNYRISQYELDAPMDITYHIPLDSADGMYGTGTNFTEYCSTKQWFHIRDTSGLIYSAKLVDIEDMPEMTQYFGMSGNDFTMPIESEKVVDLVAVMSEDSKTVTKWVEITITNDVAKFRCQRQDLGWIEKEVPIEYKGGEVKFMLNPSFAKAILKKTRNFTLVDKFCIFQYGNFKHLIALAG